MSIESPTHFLSEEKFPLIIEKVGKIHGIDIDAKTVLNVCIVSTACGIADDEYDRCLSLEQRKKIYLNSLDYLFGNKESLDNTGSITFDAYKESMEYLKNFIGELPEKNRWKLRSNLRVWNRISEGRRNEINTSRSIDMRLSDLDLTALVYLSAIPNISNNKSDVEFIDCIRKMVRIAGMIDDAMDMSDDFKNSIIGIKPTLKNRIKFLTQAIIEGLPLCGKTLGTGLLIDSIDIMKREFRRRKTVNNYEQYLLQEEPFQKI